MFRFVLENNNTPTPSYKSHLKRTRTKANIAMSNCDIESLLVSIFGGNREGEGREGGAPFLPWKTEQKPAPNSHTNTPCHPGPAQLMLPNTTNTKTQINE